MTYLISFISLGPVGKVEATLVFSFFSPLFVSFFLSFLSLFLLLNCQRACVLTSERQREIISSGLWTSCNPFFSISQSCQDLGHSCPQCFFKPLDPGFEPWSAMWDLVPSTTRPRACLKLVFLIEFHVENWLNWYGNLAQEKTLR